MEIKIIIDAPKGWKRRVLMFVVTPVALVAALGAAAYATQQQLDTSWIGDTKPVSASSLSTDLANANANFTDLYAQLKALEPIAPTVQTFTSGAGTYTATAGVPHAPLYLRVRMAGGGGGGAGISGSGYAAGTDGGSTKFGPLTAAGGYHAFDLTGQAGGAQATITGAGVQALVNLPGGGGGSSSNLPSFPIPGGAGGNNPFGGGGASAASNNPGFPAVGNTGGGGGGAGCTNPTGTCAGGGGAGAYIEAIITNPAATYSYSVGTGGTGGQGSNYVGGSGAAGVIIVEEVYQ